jgi:radical SAM superfamily enzyme YgiQ (UPF0313 family)
MEMLDTLQTPNAKDSPLQKEEPDVTTPVVCLISALAVEDFLDPELTINTQKRSPQLGVMTLAAILREKGFRLKIVNLDDLYFAFLRASKVEPMTHLQDPADLTLLRDGNIERSEIEKPVSFLSFVIEHLKSLSCDVFGLSSICSSYPLTLRLAQEVKRLNPNATLILGGPQASVVDVPTMRAFPCIDFIIRGEADETFPALLDLLFHSRFDSWEDIPGITFRRGEELIRNRNAPVIRDLDCLPLPAFELDPDLKDRAGGIHLEIGRGCPFTCTFCSTNDFFRRNFRLKSPGKMIEQITFIKQEYGIRYFSFVHDMYTIDRKRVVAFCRSVLACKEQFTWGCSARTDCIDDELLGLMAEAGCRGIFFGIETGSKRLQTVIDKKLDLDEARKRIECADRHGIKMSVALITGFPDETRDDLRDTVHFFIDSLRFDHAEPQISLLAPLAATPIHEQYKDQLVFDHIFSDMSHQGWQHDQADVEMIKTYPEVFPNFYAIPTKWLDRAYLKEIRDFLIYVTIRFRWLPVALLQDSGDFLKVFDRWRRWLAEKNAIESDEDIGLVLYYAHPKFRKDFLEFVQTCYLEEMATARVAIETLARTEDILAGLRWWTSQPIESADLLDANCVPYWRPANLRVLDIEIDYNELIESLRHQTDLGRIPEWKGTIAFLLIDAGHSEQKGKTETQLQVWQLAPLSATLLRLCDGKRTTGEIVQEFCELEKAVDGVPAEKVCLFGLMQLRKDGFIGISSCPVMTEAEADSNDGEKAIISWPSPTSQMGNTQQPWPPRNAVSWRGSERG